MRYLVTTLVLLSFLSCSRDESKSPDEGHRDLFELREPGETNLEFTNEVNDQKDFNVLTYRNYYNGGGVAIGDLNNDSQPDVYFTANMSSNKLFINEGDWKFSDLTEKAGVGGKMSWSTGVTFADVNGDGWMDIYVCNSGDVAGDQKANELFINQRDLTFLEQAEEYGLNDHGFSTHASFFDYDRDGDLDMYLVNNSFKDPSRIDFKNVRFERNDEGGDKLFRNDGARFTDVSEEAGIYGSRIGFGLGVSVSDVDGDGWPDIYISNDFWERDYLYFNNRDGSFTEDLTNRIPMTSTSSMGADIADINNDGTFEIFSTDMLPATNHRLKTTTIFNNYDLQDLKYRNDYHYQYTQNCLQLNNGQGQFVEIANLTGMAATDWSWGALIFDFNNDGLKDIFVSNGVFRDITDLDFSDFMEDKVEIEKVVRDKGRFDLGDFLEYLPSTRIPNYAFVNHGHLNFKNEAKKIGLGAPSFSNGSAYGDLDNDGDLDLIVSNVNMPAHIYENHSERLENNYLVLSFSSSGKNSFGIGTRVEAYVDSTSYHFQNFQSRGFQSSTEPLISIGLGNTQSVDSLHIFWPNGTCTQLFNVGVNQRLDLKQEDAQVCDRSDLNMKTADTPSFFEKVDLVNTDDSRHNENLFNDFDIENLIPHMVSTEGPEILTGDINGDNLEDYILLGAANDEDKVFIQRPNGRFERLNQSAMSQDSKFESTCGLLIDLDMDGDLDLLIGSGGNDPSYKYEDYVLRIYDNDGSGLFQYGSDAGIKALGNFSVIEEIQLTEHSRGLFIGGRIVPGNYGLDPRNYLFAESGPGTWREITTEAVGKTGMVTDAASLDLDNDLDDDLVIVGEWMPILIFENADGNLMLKGSVPQSEGWWQSITIHDANNDGLMDLVLGNWGENSKFQASKEKPLKLYINDFDQNKKVECILEWFAPEDDHATLFASKNDLTRQLPALKKMILKNNDYAEVRLQDLFSESQLSSGLTRLTNTLKSSILINRGEFRFDLKALPKEAQLAPVFSIATVDIDSDGLEDLILGGNMYGLKPEVGRLDSSNGLVLLNKGDGTYMSMTSLQSGIFVSGEIRSIVPLDRPGQTKTIVIGINNQPTEFFKIRDKELQ